MLRKVLSIVVAASLAAALASTAACGQKGPLYVPGVPKGAAWPYPDRPRKSAPADPGPSAPDIPGTSDPAK